VADQRAIAQPRVGAHIDGIGHAPRFLWRQHRRLAALHRSRTNRKTPIRSFLRFIVFKIVFMLGFLARCSTLSDDADLIGVMFTIGTKAAQLGDHRGGLLAWRCRTDEGSQIVVERAGARPVELARQGFEVSVLAGLGPIDANAGAICEFIMDNHQRTAVAVEERMRMCEIAHHLTRMLRHVGAILAKPQRIVNGVVDKSRMRKKIGAIAPGNGDAGRSGPTVLARPRIYVPKKNPVGVEHVLISDRLDVL
jgi:hypothetical protein